MQKTLLEIYEALCERGYDPTKQIAGYILSEDPVYITDWKNARGKISHINRDDLLNVLINSYLGIESK
ncbi:MAG: IreB family regulatory phosphoprotein [Ruminococcaceae bacterium]|nr:IreB family regulatory phosphoprotein [Oscillospiraceae bacterium]